MCKSNGKTPAKHTVGQRKSKGKPPQRMSLSLQESGIKRKRSHDAITESVNENHTPVGCIDL